MYIVKIKCQIGGSKKDVGVEEGSRLVARLIKLQLVPNSHGTGSGFWAVALYHEIQE